jgi:hypothetical protein
MEGWNEDMNQSITIRTDLGSADHSKQLMIELTIRIQVNGRVEGGSGWLQNGMAPQEKR